MFINTYRLIFVNLFIFSLVIVGFFYGYLGPFFTDDITHISYIIAFLMFVNVILRVWETYQCDLSINRLRIRSEMPAARYLNYVLAQFLYIGILGTLIGFSHLIKSIQDLTDVEKVLRLMTEGSLTLFNTTALAVVAYLWSRLNTFLAEGE